MPRVESNPHYGPCPLRGSRRVIKMVDPGDVCCVCTTTEFVDGHTYLILPCSHFFCRKCLRKMVKRTEESDEDAAAVRSDEDEPERPPPSRLRCHCGRSYSSVELKKAVEFRALVRGQIIDLSDDYVSATVKLEAEPVEYV